MKRFLPVCIAFLAGCSLAVFAQDSAKPDSKMSDSKMSASTMTSKSDSKFAMEAAGGGMAEVKLGELAQEKGSSQFVKDFGKKMVDDHSKANDDLKSIAAKNNITLPSDMPPKHQALYDQLSKLSGDEFDKAYLAAMLKDHKKDVAAFQKESTNGKNPDLKEFASKTLPVIQGHLQMLQSQKMTS